MNSSKIRYEIYHHYGDDDAAMYYVISWNEDGSATQITGDMSHEAAIRWIKAMEVS